MFEMNTQASLLAATSYTAEVSRLKWRLEQAEEELDQVRSSFEKNKV